MDGGTLTVDGAGNVVVAGGYRDAIDLGQGPIGAGGTETDAGIFVAKYSPSGELVFGQAWKGSGFNGTTGVSATPDGRTLVGGFAQRIDFGPGVITGGGNDQVGWVLLLESNGDVAWSRQAFNGRVSHVASDASGGAVVIGWGFGQVHFGGTPVASRGGGNDFMVARLSPAGVQTEVTLFGSTTGQEANLSGAAVDSDGNVYLTGTTDTAAMAFGTGPSLTAGAYFVASVARGGAHRYSFSFQGEGLFAGVALDAAGRAWITGAHTGAFAAGTQYIAGAPLRAGLLLRASTTGVVDWLRSYGGSTTPDITAFVATDAAGRPTVAGAFGNGVDFGTGTLATANSLVVARLEP